MSKIPISAFYNGDSGRVVYEASRAGCLYKFFLGEREQEVIRGLSTDVRHMCREALQVATERKVFGARSCFTMCVPRFKGIAKICSVDVPPEPSKTSYISIGFARHDGDIYISSVECVEDE